MRSRPSSRRSTPTRRTLCGAWVTSSATDRAERGDRDRPGAGRDQPGRQSRPRGSRAAGPRGVLPDAAVSARWTQTVLLDEHRAYLDSLVPEAKAEGAELYHASPRDPVWEYVITEESARDALELTVAPVVLVGHSHVALALTLVAGRLQGDLAPAGSEVGLDSGRWLLNPGSVGQPRDGDPRAAWLQLDLPVRAGSIRPRRLRHRAHAGRDQGTGAARDASRAPVPRRLGAELRRELPSSPRRR